MVQCLSAGDGEQSCLQSRHAVMPLWGCDNPFAGLLNISWPSPDERATNFIPRLQQNNTNKPSQIWWTELFSHGRESASVLRSRKNPRGTQPFHKVWKKNEKEWDLIKCVPFEKICHSNIKWKPGSVIVPLTWLHLKWPLSNRVCGHGTGSCSCLQCVFAALVMWISSDCCCVEKYQTCSLQGKLSSQKQSEEQKYWSFKNCCYY